MELFRKKESSYWWYEFVIRGKRFRGSTKERNEGRARKIAALKFARCGTRRQGWVFPSKCAAEGCLTTLAPRFREARRKGWSPGESGSVLRPARLWHSAAERNREPKLVMQTMGHIDTKTALKYQHPELDLVRAALNRTDPEWHCNVPGGPAMARFTAQVGNSVEINWQVIEKMVSAEGIEPSTY